MKCIRWYVVPARMRKTDLLPRLGKNVVSDPGTFKDTEPLVTQPAAFDTVAMKNTCMGGQARTHRREGIAFRPFDQLCELRPVGFVVQLRGAGLRTGNDYSVKLSCPEITEF